MKGKANTMVVVGVVVVAALLAAFLFLGRRKTATGDNVKVEPGDVKTPSVGGGITQIVPFQTWYNQRVKDNWSLYTPVYS